MAKVSLKVVVAGRTYPLSVNESEKDAIVNAAENINRRVQLLQKSYAVKDMQDLLAMTALQLAASPDKNQNVAPQNDLSEATNQLKHLLEEISI